MQSRPELPKFDRKLLQKVLYVPCLSAKARRPPFVASIRISTRPIELIHLDISVKFEPSYDRFRYKVAILDDFTAKFDVMLLKIKSGFGLKLANIRMDRAGESLVQVVKIFCSCNGIRLETSSPYAPQSNGTEERLIQEHRTRARVVMFDSNLPNELCPQVIEHDFATANYLPSHKLGFRS